MAKFWGLVMDSGRHYMQKVETGFCITMAILDIDSKDNQEKSSIKLYVERDKIQFLLGSLNPRFNPQLPLRIKFGKGETVALYFQGGSPANKLHLSGYSLEDDRSLLSVPFQGQQQSILVTEPRSAESNKKDKKRVSIKDSPAATRKASSSSDDTDGDDDDEGDDVLALTNGVVSDDSDEDEIQFIPSRADAVAKKLAEFDDDDDDSEDDSDDDFIDDDDSDAESIEVDESPTPGSSSTEKPKQQQSTPKPTKADKKQKKNDTSASQMKTPENQHLKLKQQPPSSAGHTPMKMFSKGGVMCQDVKVGNGPPAKDGRMVTVYYCGRLKSNNKKFDASESGPGFKFKLGKGEVIKGWDLGVEGMKIGGKRRLIIPANLA